jgi:glutamine synthetase
MSHVVSTAVKYQTRLVQTAKALKDMELSNEAAPVIQIIKEISERVTIISKLVYDMTEARKKINTIDDIEEQAKLYGTEVRGFFEEIRYHVDKLEILIDDEDWPLVKYRELLYIR